MSTITLAVDTSSSSTFISLIKDSKIHTLSTAADNSHNEEIDQLVRQAAKNSAIEFKDISRLIVGAGPGSFTGLRIGYAYMKGLASALKLPLFAYSGLEAAGYYLLEQKLIEDDSILCCLSDARRGEYFVTLQIASNGRVNPILKPCILNAEQLNAHLGNVNKKLCYLNFSLQEPDIACEYLRISSDFPLSEALNLMHEKNGEAKNFSLNELAAETPLYLREVAAKSLKDRGIEL